MPPPNSQLTKVMSTSPVTAIMPPGTPLELPFKKRMLRIVICMGQQWVVMHDSRGVQGFGVRGSGWHRPCLTTSCYSTMCGVPGACALGLALQACW